MVPQNYFSYRKSVCSKRLGGLSRYWWAKQLHRISCKICSVLISNARCHNDSSDCDMEIGVPNPKKVKVADISNDKRFDK